MTSAQIKKEVSKGCPAWTQIALWTWQFWGGGVGWNSDKTEIADLGGLAWIMFYDGYRRAAFRMSLTQPEKAKESEVKEAIYLHKQEWTKTVENFNNHEAKLIEDQLAVKDDVIESVGVLVLDGQETDEIFVIHVTCFALQLVSEVRAVQVLRRVDLDWKALVMRDVREPGEEVGHVLCEIDVQL